MSEEVASNEVSRDNVERGPWNAVDADRNDDEEGRLHNWSKGYACTGANEAFPSMRKSETRKRRWR